MNVKSWIVSAILLVSLTACGDFANIQEQADEKFGDQHFKTAIALIELHKVRFGEYPQSLEELKFVGDWDIMALNSVEYTKLDNGYDLNVTRGWVSEPKLDYPKEFWQGLGLKNRVVFQKVC